jgi:branched-chain amino acid transport system ATP-binding protein
VHRLIEVEHLNAFYGSTQVLFDISFGMEEGTITAILGANGAGKTTTLRAICQTVNTNGEMYFRGTRIDGSGTEDIVRRGIAHVPEGRGTFSALTTEENLRLGAYSRGSKLEMNRDLDLAYTRFPRLKERRHQQAGTLSGGEQQMLAISRALMLRPGVLLLDEPSFGLAPLVIEEIFDMMRQVRGENKTSILLVEQNANLALELSDHAYVLETGRIVMAGTSEEIGRDESIRHSYLGV